MIEEVIIPTKLLPKIWPKLLNLDLENPDDWLKVLDFEALAEADMSGAGYLWDVVAGCFNITSYNTYVSEVLARTVLKVFNAVNEEKNFEFINATPDGEVHLTMTYNLGDFSELFEYGTSIRGMYFNLGGPDGYVLKPTTITGESIYGNEEGPTVRTKQQMNALLTAINRFVEMHEDNEVIYARTHKEE